MERAGMGAANEIERRYSERLRRGAAVFVGPGNNGGDGWLVAGTLAKRGFPINVIEVGHQSAKSPDAIAARESAIGAVQLADSDVNSPIVIDALLGTGFSGQPRSPIAPAIDAINGLRRVAATVVALDVPSGLDGTTGEHNQCVVADLTISFGGIKRGTLLARDCCGEIVAVDIGLDNESEKVNAIGDNAGNAGRLPVLIDDHYVRTKIPPIHFDAHKGTRKHLAIIGAGKGMPGAVVLAARAALRSGIGLVKTVVAADSATAVGAAVPAALNSEWPASTAEIKSSISSWADAIVLGPGLGKSDEARVLVERILSDSQLPVLLDADALNLFAGETQSLSKLLAGRQTLRTPHVAEFARLSGVDVKDVIANRFDIGVDIARSLGATVLLKGAPTVVFSPSGERFVIARGTAALGTGGSGDLLAGIAGTLLAQTGDAISAACCAAWVHGRAAELCGYVRGTTLDDVLYALPRAWNEPEPRPEPPLLAILPGVAA
jgi:hydroxyethylthiazole kinase-like uncharacterized protein yjeF